MLPSVWPVTPRPHLDQPIGVRPRFPERLGLAEPRDRPSPLAPLVASYDRLLTISINVAVAAIEVATSAELHSPFIVNAVRMTGITLGSVDIRGAITIIKDNPTAGSTAAVDPRPIWWPTGEIANGQLMRVADLEDSGPVGQIVRDVPCRVALVCQNSSGGAIAIVASVHITHLRPARPFRADLPIERIEVV